MPKVPPEGRASSWRWDQPALPAPAAAPGSSTRMLPRQDMTPGADREGMRGYSQQGLPEQGAFCQPTYPEGQWGRGGRRRSGRAPQEGAWPWAHPAATRGSTAGERCWGCRGPGSQGGARMIVDRVQRVNKHHVRSLRRLAREQR